MEEVSTILSRFGAFISQGESSFFLSLQGKNKRVRFALSHKFNGPPPISQNRAGTLMGTAACLIDRCCGFLVENGSRFNDVLCRWLNTLNCVLPFIHTCCRSLISRPCAAAVICGVMCSSCLTGDREGNKGRQGRKEGETFCFVFGYRWGAGDSTANSSDLPNAIVTL